MTWVFGGGLCVTNSKKRRVAERPIFFHILRPPSRHYLSDASSDAIGGYYLELMKTFWRYTLNPLLSMELKQKAAANETTSITISALELVEMIITCWVM